MKHLLKMPAVLALAGGMVLAGAPALWAFDEAENKDDPGGETQGAEDYNSSRSNHSNSREKKVDKENRRQKAEDGNSDRSNSSNSREKDNEIWTEWLNRDTPGGSGDYETVKDFIASGQIDPDPDGIQCRISDGRAWQAGGQDYTCQVEVGGVCANSQQNAGEQCLDYEVRFRYKPE